MDLLQHLSSAEAELISGGALTNPSETYDGQNWGQFKKDGGVDLNPSMHYCRGMSNYGQVQKPGGGCG